MHKTSKRVYVILAGFGLVIVVGGMGLIYSREVPQTKPKDELRLPVLITYKGEAAALERAEVAFDHDLHTRTLKQQNKADCEVCHLIEEKDKYIQGEKVVTVLKFPKRPLNRNDKTAIMEAYHDACGSCHRERAGAAKKTGPDIGLCGKCHVRKIKIEKVTWPWTPIFNYKRHDRHVKALDRVDKPVKASPKVVTVAEKPEEKTDSPDEHVKLAPHKCQLCHHLYDEKDKRLIYKKNSENSCRACHKEKGEKNRRPMKMVAHAQCIGCHMELAEAVRKTLAAQGKKELTEEDKRKFGPFECKGCHGEHETLKEDEIVTIPRLVRGQKDVMDIFLKDPKKDPKAARMKIVPFNHKAHEPRAQFCSSCHHYSLEKCVNCHTPVANLKDGGGVSFERAFHKLLAQQSCLGCHEIRQTKNECAGCHQWLTAEMPQQSCPICHRGSLEGKPIEVAPVVVQFDKERVPEKVKIEKLAKEYQPSEMPHQKITKKLTEISNKSSLARVFHPAKSPNDQTLCQGCHHYSREPAAKKFPGCRACHGQPFNPIQLGKPGIMAAYHQQCIGCHTAMGHKPKALECDKCHPEKKEKPTTTVKVDIPLRGYWK